MVKIYDTTLRDGAQSEDVAFSLEDMVRVSLKLDELGVHYIEGGWPGSNPRDAAYFKEIKRHKLAVSKTAAFGSTRRAKTKADADPNLLALVETGTPAVTIFGKSWGLHVKEALKVSLEENLDMINSSVSFLKENVREVFYDAEHFFDGYKSNPAYAIKTLKAAQDAGADCLVLCDTNGGALTWEIEKIIAEVKEKVSAPIGIHCHNDSDLAVANSLAAVRLGAAQVQGTMNGYGERCGNANLCSVIPALKLKMGIDTLPADRIPKIREVSRFVAELANLKPFKHQPYVGDSAFAHKGGIHVSAVRKNSTTYEHINPELVGNTQRILVSDLSGRSNIISKAKEYGLDVDKLDNASIKKILNELKDREKQGYLYEAAEGSFQLLIHKIINGRKPLLKLDNCWVHVDWHEHEKIHHIDSVAMIRINVDGMDEHTSAKGDGPVNALAKALIKAVGHHFDAIKHIELKDYSVRVLGKGTEARVRVLIESGDKTGEWGTVGVSENIIKASWEALVDSIEYRLLKEKT
jgi:2-isopropylmalate synthase